MNWWNRFGRSLLFAILVAGVYPIYASVASLVVGTRLAFAAYLLVSAAVYLLGIARNPTTGLAAAAATMGVGVLCVTFGASGIELLLVTCVLIGIFRSGLLQSSSRRDTLDFTRRFARELLFVGGGLVLANYFARGSLHPEAFAFWGFYLFQSGFYLLGGDAAHDRRQRAQKVDPDAFTKAVKRAREVLAANP